MTLSCFNKNHVISLFFLIAGQVIEASLPQPTAVLIGAVTAHQIQNQWVIPAIFTGVLTVVSVLAAWKSIQATDYYLELQAAEKKHAAYKQQITEYQEKIKEFYSTMDATTQRLSAMHQELTQANQALFDMRQRLKSELEPSSVSIERVYTGSELCRDMISARESAKESTWEEEEKKAIVQDNCFRDYVGDVPPVVRQALQYVNDDDVLKSYEIHNMVLPSGILFVGPAGSGKTYLRNLFAVALDSAAKVKRAKLLVGKEAYTYLKDGPEMGSSADDTPTFIMLDDIEYTTRHEIEYMSRIRKFFDQLSLVRAAQESWHKFESITLVACARDVSDVPLKLIGAGRFEEVIKLPSIYTISDGIEKLLKVWCFQHKFGWGIFTSDANSKILSDAVVFFTHQAPQSAGNIVHLLNEALSKVVHKQGACTATVVLDELMSGVDEEGLR